jgi:ParB family chromosome partitioning protein
MVKAPRGLGRGLDALLGGEEKPGPVRDSVGTLPVDALQPGKYQPRTRMDQSALEELSVSIKSQGVMQPILVRPVGEGRHEIIAGERRWRAARMAGLTNVPVLIREIPDQHALAAALIENIQREDLNPLEEALGIQRLIDEFGLTHQAVSESVGRSRAAVSNLLRLLDLPPVIRGMVNEGKLEMGHARALLAVPGARQLDLARKAADEGWSVREVERRVSLVARPASPLKKARVDRDVARLEEELAQRLGTMVQVLNSPKGGKGRLVIYYQSLDQLDGLISRLR